MAWAKAIFLWTFSFMWAFEPIFVFGKLYEGDCSLVYVIKKGNTFYTIHGACCNKDVTWMALMDANSRDPGKEQDAVIDVGEKLCLDSCQPTGRLIETDFPECDMSGPELDRVLVISTTCSIASVIVLVSAAVLLFYFKHRRRTVQTHIRREAIRKRLPKKLLEQYEINRNRIRIGRLVGSGSNGRVMEGSMRSNRTSSKRGTENWLPVAFKFQNWNLDRGQAEEEFLAEISVLMKISRPHQNIVNFLGVVLSGDRPMIVMEYCELSSLDDFLRNYKAQLTFSVSKTCSQASRPDKYPEALQRRNSAIRKFEAADLVRFACEVCRGMEFLNRHNVIHRDLAARNVLLDHRVSAKISDFGMAWDGSAKPEPANEVSLPVRWLAPESFSFSSVAQFSTHSDVWAFGIFLWELFSLGETPYEAEFPSRMTQEKACQLHRFLREGHRLSMPCFAPSAVCDMMRECWSADPSARPGFGNLRPRLENLLPAGTKEGYVKFDEANEMFNKKVDEIFETNIETSAA